MNSPQSISRVGRRARNNENLPEGPKLYVFLQNARLLLLRLRPLRLIFLCLLLAGCAGNQAHRNADRALQGKNWDVAVAEYSRALVQDPNNPEIKLKLNMAKVLASRSHYEEARRKLEAERFQDAAIELELAIDLDPSNQAAQDEMEALKKRVETQRTEDLSKQPEARPVSELPSVALEPEFRPQGDTPIELRFRDTSLREVLQSLGKAGDINVLFDKDVQNLPVSFDFTNTTFLQALDTVLTSTHHFYKVIGQNTIVIAPDTPAKRGEYEETVSRTFYLSNADVEEVARVLRNVLGIQMIATDVRLNAVTIKDRITRVLAADKVVRQIDKPKAEVVVDVDILEVSRTRFQQYGLQIHSSGVEGIQSSLITEPEKLALEPGPVVSRSNFFIVNFPQATLRLLRQDSDTRLIASLPLRTVVGETGRVRFGSQVPVPQTTFAPIATGGVNQQPITSFIYRDVGINIDITPRVHRDGDVTLETIIESSAIQGTGFGNLPRFSTSRVEKTIRLREGETSIVAGLIRDEERQSISGIPGLASIPLLGRLFASNEKEIQETDIVLSLSPHILRRMEITAEDENMIWLGIDETQGTAFKPYNYPIPSIQPPSREEPDEDKGHRRNDEEEYAPEDEEEYSPDEY